MQTAHLHLPCLAVLTARVQCHSVKTIHLQPFSSSLICPSWTWTWVSWIQCYSHLILSLNQNPLWPGHLIDPPIFVWKVLGLHGTFIGLMTFASTLVANSKSTLSFRSFIEASIQCILVFLVTFLVLVLVILVRKLVPIMCV